MALAVERQAAAQRAQAAQSIEADVAAQKLSADGLQVEFDAATGTVMGVAQVNDPMTVGQPADNSKFHTVAKGDTLSAI
ncbi:MAG TPA: hypothetical protein VFL86_11280, partial [Burkholderiaceae bacterium]|nr:hypothetical protein [Burkholderiaceae bacterium]